MWREDKLINEKLILVLVCLFAICLVACSSTEKFEISKGQTNSSWYYNDEENYSSIYQIIGDVYVLNGKKVLTCDSYSVVLIMKFDDEYIDNTISIYSDYLVGKLPAYVSYKQDMKDESPAWTCVPFEPNSSGMLILDDYDGVSIINDLIESNSGVFIIGFVGMEEQLALRVNCNNLKLFYDNYLK